MEENTIRSAQRMFQLMELLAVHGETGVTELGALSGLNKATVFRQLNTLVAMGYARQNTATGKYSLTFKLLHIASRLLEQNDLRTLVQPYLRALATDTGETVHLVQQEDTHIVYIDKVEPNVNSIRMVSRVGMRQPLTCTAVGKALLAERTDEEIAAVWQHEPNCALTPHTIVDQQIFENVIRQVRACGYATDDEENELGVRCVAVALPDYTGRCSHAVSVSAPISRMPDERVPNIAARLLDMKRALINSWS